MNIHRKFLRLLLLLGSIRRKNIILKIDKDEFENRFFNKVEYINLWTESDTNFRTITSNKKYKGQFFPNEFLIYENGSLFDSRENSQLSIYGFYWYFENQTKVRLTVKPENLILVIDFIFIPIFFIILSQVIFGNFTPLSVLIGFTVCRIYLYFKIKKIFYDVLNEIDKMNS